jgi:hypothetical protein
MKDQALITTAASVLIAIVMIERYYHHPTYGNGMRAALAAAKAALTIG